MAKKFWFPDPIWEGEPCYIIGGGSSLAGFDWDILKGRKVLGCTVAFYLGSSLVPFAIFGDAAFLEQHRHGLEKYAREGGIVVTNSNRVKKDTPDWLKRMRKVKDGLSTEALGWNGNTGSSAINLALLFGANPIYLLGYDMRISADGKRKNFHNAYNDQPNPKAYDRFKRGMVQVGEDLTRLFPGRRVINLEDGTSGLEVFPKESLGEHFCGKGGGTK